MKCIICHNKTSILYTNLPDLFYPNLADLYSLAGCVSCGFVFIYPVPSQDEIQRHEAGTKTIPHKTAELAYRRSNVRNTTNKIIAKVYFGYDNNIPRWFLPIIKLILYPLYLRHDDLPTKKLGGRLLDVGCGAAVKMPLFRSLGWEVHGIDIDPLNAEVAERLGFKVYIESVENVDLPEDYFDVAYLSHILEHLVKPYEALLNLKKALKPGGELLITLPNGKSLARRVFGKNYFWCQIPRHFAFYTKDSLVKLLENCGFQIERISYKNTFNMIAQSLLFKIPFFRVPPGYNYMKRIERFLSFASTMVDPISNMLGIGGYITVRAKKR